MINIIYMAAGNSRRFGSNKLFYEIDGKPMYRHVLDRLLEIMTDGSENTAISQGIDITVVTQYRQIMDYCNNINDVQDGHDMYGLQLHTVYSPDSHKGASYTIKAGIKAVQDRYGYKDMDSHYLMFVVADQPYLKKESLIKLIRAVKTADGPQARAFLMRCGQMPGNPCVFHGSLIPELMELEGDQGGRMVLKRHDCVYVDIDDPKELHDIDICGT